LKKTLEEKTQLFEKQLAELKAEKDALEIKHKESVNKLESDIKNAKV
jgi:hypothetical protein